MCSVFSYTNDSVMVVTEEDYDRCNSPRPLHFYNNGSDTVCEFDRSGPFYFISGMAGHCEKGEKMIIRVLGHDALPPPSGPEDGPPEPSAAVPRARISYILIAPQLVMLFLGFFFHKVY